MLCSGNGRCERAEYNHALRTYVSASGDTNRPSHRPSWFTPQTISASRWHTLAENYAKGKMTMTTTVSNASLYATDYSQESWIKTSLFVETSVRWANFDFKTLLKFPVKGAIVWVELELVRPIVDINALTQRHRLFPLNPEMKSSQYFLDQVDYGQNSVSSI